MRVSAILLTSVQLAIWCNLHTTFWEQLCLITSLRTLLWSSTTCVPLIRRPTKIQVVSRWRRTSCSWRSTCQWIICLDNLLVGSYRHSFGTFCNVGVIFYKFRNMHLGSTDFLPTANSRWVASKSWPSDMCDVMDSTDCKCFGDTRYLVVFLAWLSLASLA